MPPPAVAHPQLVAGLRGLGVHGGSGHPQLFPAAELTRFAVAWIEDRFS